MTTAHATLPIAVRRARPDDRDVVLGFATNTWDGWDYIPQAWPHWIGADDAVLLVATAQDDDRPIALTRVALLSDTEGWLEGIRVDPAVRGHGVATRLQVAELTWARAHGLHVLRYATGHGNEGSLRLGARGGFVRLSDRRTYGRPKLEAATDEASHKPDTAREQEGRRLLLAALAAEGLVLPAGAPGLEIEAAWRIIERDATFAAGDRLYELRQWALQELTAERFGAHARAGEVLLDPDHRAVAILPRVGRRYSEDLRPQLTVLAGDGRAALELLLAVERLAAGQPVTVRLPDPDPPLLGNPQTAAAWTGAGIEAHRYPLAILARSLPVDEPQPAADPPSALEFRDPPRRVARAPEIGA
ncbi:MAG: GNAT family N-acetyltransferase [Candidatus Limnocylindrales bacterium]